MAERFDHESVTRVLVEYGVAEPRNGVHSWRCEYPDVYGPCDCLDDLAKAIVALQEPPR